MRLWVVPVKMLSFLRNFLFFFVVGLATADWTLQSDTTATVIVGVGAGNAGAAIGAASENGAGAEVVYSADGSSWVKSKVQSGLLPDAAVSATRPSRL